MRLSTSETSHLTSFPTRYIGDPVSSCPRCGRHLGDYFAEFCECERRENWSFEISGSYGYSPYGGGYGWTSDSGSYTGYTYGSNPYSGWGYQSSYNTWS